MSTSHTALPPGSTAVEDRKLPLSPLLALATAAFITVLTEALPAGVLRGMSAGLGVSESATGQLVTVYAIGTVAAAIPLSAVTSTWPRKRLLLAGVAGSRSPTPSPPCPRTSRSPWSPGWSPAWPRAWCGRCWPGTPARSRRNACAARPPRWSWPASRSPCRSACPRARSSAARSAGVPRSAMTATAVALVAWVVVAVPDRPGQPRAAGSRSRRTLRAARRGAGAVRDAGVRARAHDPLHLHRRVPGAARPGRPGRRGAARVRRGVGGGHLGRGRAHRPPPARAHDRRRRPVRGRGHRAGPPRPWSTSRRRCGAWRSAACRRC